MYTKERRRSVGPDGKDLRTTARMASFQVREKKKARKTAALRRLTSFLAVQCNSLRVQAFNGPPLTGLSKRKSDLFFFRVGESETRGFRTTGLLYGEEGAIGIEVDRNYAWMQTINAREREFLERKVWNAGFRGRRGVLWLEFMRARCAASSYFLTAD